MDAFLTSTTIVTLAEIGDKTQLLAILLATRFRAPLPIILGIFAATIANHFLAALLGASVASLLDGDWFRYLIAASFIAMAAWTLVPDKVDDLDDKPARFDNLFMVTMGTTLGMMLANVPAVFLGHELIERVPLNIVRIIAALLFLVLGLWLAAQTAGWI